MKLLTIILFCSACGVNHVSELCSVPPSSLLQKYKKGILYHAKRMAEVTSLAGLGKNAKAMNEILAKARQEMAANIEQLDDTAEKLQVNSEFRQWAFNLNQELAYYSDGEFSFNVNFAKAKDKQAVAFVLQNLQEANRMLLADLEGVEKHFKSVGLNPIKKAAQEGHTKMVASLIGLQGELPNPRISFFDQKIAAFAVKLGVEMPVRAAEVP